MRTRLVLTALITGATLVAAAGCAADSSPLPGRSATPAPSGSAATSAAPGIAPDTSCNPRASLRPTGALPQPGHMPAGSYMKTIQDRGRLILGTSQDTLLFSSRNPFNGQVEGFDVDMGRQIAAAIFGDPSKIQIKVIGYDKRVSSAYDGSVETSTFCPAL